MRVVLVTENYPYPPYGGDTIIAYNWLKELAKRHDVLLISFRTPGEQIDSTALKKFCPLIRLVSRHGQFRIFLNGMLSLLDHRPYSLGRFDWRRLWNELQTVQRHYSANIIVFIGPNGVGLASKLHELEIPVIFVPYDSVSLDLDRRLPTIRSPIQKLMIKTQLYLWRRVERELFPKFAICVVVSKEQREAIMKNWNGGLGSVVTIQNGVDTSWFHPMNIPPDYPSIIFTGNMGAFQSRHAIQYCYHEIFRPLRARCSELKWYIVGKNPPREIRDLGDGDPNIIITGFVEDIRPYLARATVYVSPIFAGVGMKNRVLEALAMGLPVVASPSSCEGISVESGKHLLIAENGRSFVQKVHDLISSPSTRMELGENAVKLINEHYSWKQSVLRLEELFETLSSPRL